MGFMAGFGPAFSRSFESGMERRAQKEQDAFRFTMQDLINQRDKYAEWVREDGKAAKKAKSLLEGSTAPSDAYPLVVEWVKADLSEDEIRYRLNTGKFNLPSAVEGPDQVQGAEGVAPVDQQMAATGLAPDAATPAPPPSIATPAAQAKKGGLLSELFGRKKGGTADERRREGAIDKASAQLGMDPATARSMLSGNYEIQTGIPQNHGVTFTPGAPEVEPDTINTLEEARIELAEAGVSGNPERIARAERRINAIQEAISFQELRKNPEIMAGHMATIWDENGYKTTAQVISNPDGSFTNVNTQETYTEPGQVRLMTEDQKKAIDGISTSLSAETKDLKNKKADHLTAIRAAHKMIELASENNGDVLATRTPGIFQGVEGWIKDAAVLGEQVSSMLASGDGVPNDTILQLEAAQEKLIKEGDPSSLAVRKGLFETQKAIFAYMLASSMGQEGRALAENERIMFTQMAAGGVTKEQFIQNLSNILVPGARSLDAKGKMLVRGNFDLRDYVAKYGYSPEAFGLDSLEEQLMSEEDSALRETWELLVKQNTSSGKIKSIKKIETPTPVSAGSTEEIPTISSPAEAAKLPSGTRFKTPDGRVKVRP